jgi:hypothetical protein
VKTLAEARENATHRAELMRIEIGQAYVAACLEDSDRDAALIERERPMRDVYSDALYAAKSREGALTLLHQEAIDENSSRYWEHATNEMARVPAF